MNSVSALRLTKVACLPTLLLLFSACTVHERIDHEDLEGRIPDGFFATLDTYPVAPDWVESRLGRPHIMQTGPRGQQIYTYKLTRAHHKKVSFLFVVRSAAVERSGQFLHLVFVDGKLTSHWFDSEAQVQLNQPPVKTTVIRDEIPGESNNPAQEMPAGASESQPSDTSESAVTEEPAPEAGETDTDNREPSAEQSDNESSSPVFNF